MVVALVLIALAHLGVCTADRSPRPGSTATTVSVAQVTTSPDGKKKDAPPGPDGP